MAEQNLQQGANGRQRRLGVYEEVTLSLSEEEGGYAKLSDLKVLDKYSYSEEFDDPSSLLDRHPYTEGMEFYPGQTDNPYSNIDDFVDSFSDTDSEYEEEEPVGVPITQLRDKRDTTIDIIGSLCLQGVLQGLIPEEEATGGPMQILPSSILMTSNLEGQNAALDELSVMIVAKSSDIVPETPYDPNNTITGAGRGKSTRTEPHPHRRAQISVSPKSRPHSDSIANRIDVRPTTVTYIDNIVRAPPLPPIDELLPENEKKRYKVIENLLESEASFLTSLNIAIELYRKPLKTDVSTELTLDDIRHLFGPIGTLLEHHELFFAALCEQTKNWSPAKQIGDVFLASFSRRDVVRHYSKYVNNFTVAMNILEKAIKKKQRFFEFLKRQMKTSGIQLSLQALLLKPIQRFFQYLLFLKDLIKYTPTTHPDSIVLEMAEAHIEGIANYLNEAKRRSEQLTIVQYLNTALERLPHNLLLKNQRLHRQDMIQWTSLKDGKWIFKERLLFLFDYLIVCCSVKQPKLRKTSVSNRSSVIEAEHVISGDSSAFNLKYKWSCPITDVELTDPDYMKETNTIVIGGSQDENAQLRGKYDELKDEMKKLNQDFEHLYRIGGLIASLSRPYEGISMASVQNSCRVLQRKLEQSHELIRSCCEPTRVDITIPGSDGMRSHQIFMFESKLAREDWIGEFQLAKLKQTPANRQTWVSDEDDPYDFEFEESDECDTADQEPGPGGVERGRELSEKSIATETLPLVVDCMKLSHNSELSTVECATSVGNNKVWFATGNNSGAFISVVRCFLPSPMLVETFPIQSRKILCMKSVPTTSSADNRSSMTVWIGSQCGKLFLYDADSNKCLQSVQLQDSVLCIERYRNRAFVGTANGYVNVFTRAKGMHWDLKKLDHRIPLSQYSIQCFCLVSNKLWIGVQKCFVVLDMEKLHIETSHKVTNDDVSVKRMESAGAGVWIALSKGSILYLFHKDTKKPVQEINIKGSLSNIVANANIEDKLNSHVNIHITSLLVESGFLWTGTSSGATLIYRIPPLNGLPILNSRPFLAGDGHNGTVRVLVSVQTQIDKTSARFEEFMKEERERNIAGSYNKPEANAAKTLTSAAQAAPAPTPEIDRTALPRVEQVIKKLELGKEFLKSEKEALPQPQRPTPKPRLKKMKKKAAAQAAKKSEEKKEKAKEAKKNESVAPPVAPNSLPMVPVTEFSSDSTVVSPVAVTITDFEVQKDTKNAEAEIEDDHIYEIPQKPPGGPASEGDTSKPEIKEAQPYEDPASSTLKAGGAGKNSDAAGDYEIPRSTLKKDDEKPHEKPTPKIRKKIKETTEREGPDPSKKEEEAAEVEEAEYDEVPKEDVQLSGDELENRQNLKSSSDIVITPSRYEGDQILSGEAIYEHIQSSTISMAIPGRQVMPTSSSSFVFSGGDGLVNFRQGQQDSVLQQVALNTHSGRDAFKNGCPCIITFQVPETNTA
ncbi:PREDICTED: rho guanine nucleotide exchange factor 10-like protein [Amphimedon queenslandica]|uniref:DH domain-containing protein n=1 Tax=Amphimedon queenslandica TaxID=400682 RepID=A0A1X7VN11_AMPQE|nr:PREDICTED: rho guanine nucleotide exchange factor 10-like protein [Amphimedon queenslandica]|eukprot:XP_011409669.1 PREDICTED: rho guanine nucleotide exchange factor 10-like protein [Amphimedon queenslandica]